MAIDGEPKDGDFVRYIDRLTRQASTAPGQVPPRQGRAGRRERQADAIGPAGFPAPADPAASPGATTQPPDARPATLAARSGQRRIALGLTIAGLFALWHAVGRLFEALGHRPVEIDDLIPAVFLGVCAFMLLKGGSRLRASQRAPLPTLPPLATLPGGKKGRA